MSNEITKNDLAIALQEVKTTLRVELRTDVKNIVDEAIEGAIDNFAGMVSRSFDEVKESMTELSERVQKVEEGQVILIRDMDSGFSAIEQRFDRESEEKSAIKDVLSNHEVRLRRLEV